jgi:hypothetical protein
VTPSLNLPTARMAASCCPQLGTHASSSGTPSQALKSIASQAMRMRSRTSYGGMTQHSRAARLTARFTSRRCAGKCMGVAGRLNDYRCCEAIRTKSCLWIGLPTSGYWHHVQTGMPSCGAFIRRAFPHSIAPVLRLERSHVPMSKLPHAALSAADAFMLLKAVVEARCICVEHKPL